MIRQDFIIILFAFLPFFRKYEYLGDMDIHKDSGAKFLIPYNKTTGEEIRHCFRANDITGEYWVYDSDKDGRIYLDKKTNDIVVIKKHCDLRFRRKSITKCKRLSRMLKDADRPQNNINS